jgi:cell division protein FtsB
MRVAAHHQMTTTRLVLSAVTLLSGGWALGQTGPPEDNPNEPISARRVEWALQRLQQRMEQRQNEIQPILAAEIPQDAEQIRQQLGALQAQVKVIRKENDELKSQVKKLTDERNQMAYHLEQAVTAAQMAAYAAQVSRTVPVYGPGALDYGYSPFFITLPARNAVPPTFGFKRFAPGNALNPRFVAPNFAGPQAGPNPGGPATGGATTGTVVSPAGRR